MNILHIDLETFSTLDIKLGGLFKYAENCEIILCAYAFDDEPVKIIDLACGESLPVDLEDALFNPNILQTAYNASFEFNVLANHFKRPLDITQWQCTMVLGLTLGLPAGLDEIGKILNLSSDMLKISEGKKLINFFSCPVKSKSDNLIDLFHDHSSNRNFPHSNPEKWQAFKVYCKQDVVAERAIRNRLFKFAPPASEQKLWCLDQKIYSNGILLDLHLVDSAISIDHSIKVDALQQGKILTGGLNLNSNFQLLIWIEQQIGWRPTSLGKYSRALLREKDLPDNVLQLLDIKTSVKKFQAMIDSICANGRARGMFHFYGANHTGRWAGRLIQLQNLPQIHIVDLHTARLFVRYSDFSAIEARVIAWLTNESWRLDVFANGEMFKVPVEKNGVNKELRSKGKIAELACGFGADKLSLSDSDMNSIIKKWRASSPNICKLWRDFESAAVSSIKYKSPTVCKKGITFETVDDFLFVGLPSGRNIVQAIAPDYLAVAMTRLDVAGYKIVMHVHDEIVCEMPGGKGNLAEVIQIMCQPILWAHGLLLATDGDVSFFYRKD